MDLCAVIASVDKKLGTTMSDDELRDRLSACVANFALHPDAGLYGYRAINPVTKEQNQIELSFPEALAQAQAIGAGYTANYMGCEVHFDPCMPTDGFLVKTKDAIVAMRIKG
jgi:hypothetical protein